MRARSIRSTHWTRFGRACRLHATCACTCTERRSSRNRSRPSPRSNSRYESLEHCNTFEESHRVSADCGCSCSSCTLTCTTNQTDAARPAPRPILSPSRKHASGTTRTASSVQRGNPPAVESEWTNVPIHLLHAPHALRLKESERRFIATVSCHPAVARGHRVFASSHAHHPVILSFKKQQSLEVRFACVSK